MSTLKWGAMVAVSVAAFGVMACGGSGSDDSDGDTAAGGGQAITASSPLPSQVGQCGTSTITSVACDDDSSDCEVDFQNGEGSIVPHDDPENDAMFASHSGDPVTICLVSIPKGCAPGDTQGRVYKVMDNKTRVGWTAPNSPHECGGA